jgi:hypothetical protein
VEFLVMPRLGVVSFQHACDFLVGKIRPQIRAFGGVAMAIELSLIAINNMPNGIGRTDRAARGGLNPDIIENSGAQDFPLATQLRATPPALRDFCNR